MLVICFRARSRNSLAHKLPAPLELSLSVLLSLGFVGFVFVVLLCFCVSCLMGLTDFGLRNGPHSTFDSPRRDIEYASE